MQPWKRIEPTIISKIGYRVVVTKTFEMPDGKIKTWDMAGPEGSQCVACIALTPDNKVIIAREFRPGPEQFMDDAPGGFVDEGEDPESALRRELLEETNYQAGEVEYLGKIYKDAYYNGVWHYFLATNCTLQAGIQPQTNTDFIEVRLISIEELFENARRGKMTDTEAVFLAYEKLQALRHQPDTPKRKEH